MVGRGYVMNVGRCYVMNVGRGYVIRTVSQSVRDKGRYRAARAAKNIYQFNYIILNCGIVDIDRDLRDIRSRFTDFWNIFLKLTTCRNNNIRIFIYE